MARRSDHTKDEITEMSIQAAGLIVSADGQSGLSTRKVAKEIGYTVGTLYTVFKNIDDLVLHVNGRTLDELFIEMKTAVEKCADPQNCLLKLAYAYLEFARQQAERWSMIFESSYPDNQPIPDWYVQKIERTFDLVENQFKLLICDLSPYEIKHAARTLWCSVHGICVLSITRKLENTEYGSVDSLIESLIVKYLSGLTKKLR